MTGDRHAYYFRALETGETPEVDSEVQEGFYSLEGRGARYPVAAWTDDTNVRHLLIGGQHHRSDSPDGWDAMLEFESMGWLRCRAVSEASYRAAITEGKWPDLAPVSRHHNRPPEGFESLREEIAEWTHKADKIVKAGAAKTQADADRAANLVAKLRGLGKAADEGRVQEKRPHDEAAKAVQAKWVPHIDAAKVRVSQLLRFVIDPFQAEQRRAAEEAAAKVKAETGADVEVKVQAGVKGAKVAQMTVWRAEIEDFGAALAALKDHPDVKACIQSLCDAAARSKARAPIPGVKFVSTTQSR